MKKHSYEISEKDHKILSLLESIDKDCLQEMKKLIPYDEVRRGEWDEKIEIEETNVNVVFSFSSKDTFCVYEIIFTNPLGKCIGAYPIKVSLIENIFEEETEEFIDHYTEGERNEFIIRSDKDLTLAKKEIINFI